MKTQRNNVGVYFWLGKGKAKKGRKIKKKYTYFINIRIQTNGQCQGYSIGKLFFFLFSFFSVVSSNMALCRITNRCDAKRFNCLLNHLFIIPLAFCAKISLLFSIRFDFNYYLLIWFDLFGCIIIMLDNEKRNKINLNAK